MELRSRLVPAAFRAWPTAFLACALVACGEGAARGRAPAEQRPGWVDSPRHDVLLLVIDTLRADMLSDPENEVETPRLDAFARDSIVFDHAYAHAPMTLPSHTSLLASRVPFETGVLNNGDPMPDDLPLLGAHLESFGYHTEGLISMGTLMGPHMGGGLSYAFRSFRRLPGPVARGESVVAALAPVLDALAADRPFFLFAHFSDPHSPYDVHGAITKRAQLLVDGSVADELDTADMTYKVRTLALAPGRHEVRVRSADPFIIRTFDFTLAGSSVPVTLVDSALSRPTFDFGAVVENTTGSEQEYALELWINDRPAREEIPGRYVREVEYVDAWVGRLLDALVERGLYDETLIVFTSDHGEGIGQRGHIGHVHHLHDELLRVPLFVKLPRSKAGAADALRVNRERLVRHIDVVPTVLELLGLPPLPGQTGTSLLEDAGERVLLAETHRPQARRDLFTMRDDRRVMMYDVEADRFELYDRAEDPGELVDRFAELGGAYTEWQDVLRSAAVLARKGAAATGELDPEVRKQLRALGYLGDE